ncbi:MAG TPA: hypothetical protein VIY53_08425 [Acidobacteriaceae bacterium]
MRLAILLALLFPSLSAQTRSDLWKEVNPVRNSPQLQAAAVTAVQKRAIAQLILHLSAGILDETQGDRIAGTVNCLKFEKMPLAAQQNTLLVSGCTTEASGNGGFAELWLVRLDGDKPVNLVGPRDDLSGWLYSIQPSVAHGYHDLVFGEHMGAPETGLSYFRFNGQFYSSVGTATDDCGAIDDCEIHPNVRGAAK